MNPAQVEESVDRTAISTLQMWLLWENCGKETVKNERARMLFLKTVTSHSQDRLNNQIPMVIYGGGSIILL